MIVKQLSWGAVHTRVRKNVPLQSDTVGLPFWSERERGRERGEEVGRLIDRLSSFLIHSSSLSPSPSLFLRRQSYDCAWCVRDDVCMYASRQEYAGAHCILDLICPFAISLFPLSRSLSFLISSSLSASQYIY